MVKARVKAVKEIRLESRREATQKLANTPHLFAERRQPTTPYILIPRHTGESRDYIPIGFVGPEIIAGDSNLTLEYATLYHFGVLTSRMHMAWMRGVSGRLESRYRYSVDVVYNTFVWPEPTAVQKEDIETAAQKVLDERAKYPNTPYKDLYGEFMPESLRKAHTELDKAVEKAYGRTFANEDEIYTFLLDKYVEKIEDEKRQ